MGKKKSTAAVRTRVSIDYPTFVETWNASDNINEVVEGLECSPQTAYNTARKLRKAGVVLKAFPRGGRGAKPIDVEALNKLSKKGLGAKTFNELSEAK